MDKYDHNAHSVFLLYYHLILVVKYRRKVFDDEISGRAKEIFCYIAPHYGITLRNGTMMKTMCISCSGHSQKVRSVNSSMRTKALPAGC